MKTTYLNILLIIFIFVAGCTTADSSFRASYDFAQIDKIAVVAVEGDVIGEIPKNQISDFFVIELLSKGYSPIERAQVHLLLEEQDFQSQDLTSAVDAARAGRILNVPAVLVVNIPNFTNNISMTAKIINVEDATIVWAASGEGKTGKWLATLGGAAVGAAAGAAVAGDDSDNKTIGAVAGGVLGGVAGNALAPQKAKKAQEIVKKMCKKLPHR